MTPQGFMSNEVVKMCGISYRQLDYWCRSALIYPELSHGTGSGNHRRFSANDIKKILFVKILMSYTAWEAHYAAKLVKMVEWHIVNDGQDFVIGLNTHTLNFFDRTKSKLHLEEPVLIFTLDLPDQIKETS